MNNYIAYHIINGRARLLKSDNSMYAIGNQTTFWAYHRNIFAIDCNVSALKRMTICTCQALAVAV